MRSPSSSHPVPTVASEAAADAAPWPRRARGHRVAGAEHDDRLQPARPGPIVRGKVRPPAPGPDRVARPRIAAQIERLADANGIAWVTGTAGAGKTTAVLELVERYDGLAPWLTLGDAERAPGRLLTYLEAALAHAVPAVAGVVLDALAHDVPHADAAAVLAESIGDVNVLLVVDELERIAESAAAIAVLEAFLRYAPGGVRTILVSRRRFPLRVGRNRSLATAVGVGDGDLRFTVDEAKHALEMRGCGGVDASAAVEATAGWVTGVLFGAWHSPNHAFGAGGESEALRSYLSTEILQQLPASEREFLLTTSVLDQVSIERAERIGVTGAGERLVALSRFSLPVTISADARTMHVHACFRSHLLECLEQRGSGEYRDLRVQAARVLTEEGRDEEAADELLEVGALEEATDAITRAMPEVVGRLDLGVAERWLAALPAPVVERSEILTYAEIRVANEHERYARGAAAADRLAGLIRARTGSDEIRAGWAACLAWTYFLAGRIEDARKALSRASPSTPEVEAMRFTLDVDDEDRDTRYADRPADPDGALAGILARTDFGHGRLNRLLTTNGLPTIALVSSRVAALRALGRVDDALAMLTTAPQERWTLTRVRVELLADLGRGEDAEDALVAGHRLVVASGSTWFEALHLMLEAMLALRFRRDTVAAREALRRVERMPVARRRLRIVEQLGLYRGQVAMIDGDDAEAAAQLRSVVALMRRWDRLLFLPQAAVLLAEVEWRLGEPEAADQAADWALEAAEGQGSDHLLLQALREHPAVVSRRLDAKTDADTRWHELGRRLIGEGRLPHGSVTPRVRIRELDDPAIVVDGAVLRPRLSKSFELLAYLAVHGGRASRSDLLGALFDGRDDDSTRSYLRQVVLGLRRTLPDDVPLDASPEQIAWRDDGLVAESVELANTMRQAMLLRGRDRLEASSEALAPLERAEYLPGTASDWADRRRHELQTLANDVRQAAAESAYEIGEFVRAKALLDRVLDEDPYRETAWRAAMRVASAMGDGDLVLTAYQACERVLAGLGTTPAADTRRLLERLRG